MLARRLSVLNYFFAIVFLFIFRGAAQSYSVAPSFSVEHGFFDEPFDLTISSPWPDTQLAFTLDGSEPATSDKTIFVDSPHTLNIDPLSTLDRAVTPCVTVRAAVVQNGQVVGTSKTQTYIFLQNVINQSTLGERPGPEWPQPTTNGQHIDYGMDLSVTTSPLYKYDMEHALLDIPSVSIVTDLKHLFDRQTGIYVNAQYHGIEWERPASVELINPDGTSGFHINCGLRIRGGWSRHDDNPKHAFRLFFRSDYGEAKLRYPLFGDEGVDEFDKIDLRTSQNYSWSYKGDVGAYNTMNRDVYSRDIQRDMGQPYTRSRYYHLYLNGMYWGLFQTQERPEAAFAASYFGGSRADYDVVKMDIGDHWNIYDIEATDGALDAWQKIWHACEKGFWNNADYFRLQGRRWNGDPDPNGTVLVDIDNLIDYMIIIFYTGNFDAPVSKFRSNKDPNNFYALYNRNDSRGFMFFAHDAEHTLLPDPVNVGDGIVENRVAIGDIGGRNQMQVDRFEKFHPQWLHYRLSMNKEYMTRFGDRVHRYFFNNGLLTPSQAANRFQQRADEIDMAIIAESARWGDAKIFRARTKNQDWQPAINNVLKNWFPKRSDIVLDQLRAANLYPSIEAPQCVIAGQTMSDTLQFFEAKIAVTMNNPNLNFGEIYYTTDGSDPRATGGQISATAIAYEEGAHLEFESCTILKARVFSENFCSALQACRFNNTAGANGLRLTEIHYAPLAAEGASHRELEFIELKNISSMPVAVDSFQFVAGISYTFPAQRLVPPNGFVVLASNASAFQQRYGFAPDDEYDGRLDNDGDLIKLITKNGDAIVTLRYSDRYPWPMSARYDGHSLVSRTTRPVLQHSASQWRASRHVHGSPGADDPASYEESFVPASPTMQLYQNFPNPFQDRTTIRFSLNEAGYAEINVYNVLGQFVTTLLQTNLQAGSYSVEWDASNTPTGIYFYVLHTADTTKNKKLLRVR